MQKTQNATATDINPLIGNTQRDTLDNVCACLEFAATSSRDPGLSLLLLSMAAALRY